MHLEAFGEIYLKQTLASGLFHRSQLYSVHAVVEWQLYRLLQTSHLLKRRKANCL